MRPAHHESDSCVYGDGLTKRFNPERGWVDQRTRPRSPEGRPLCRRCGEPVGRGRRTFCSDPCVHEWKLRTDASYLRHHVFERDQGICAVCGLDCDGLKKALAWILRKVSWAAWRELISVLPEAQPNRRNLWDADHIVPVVEGGGQCGLDNIRTLCLPCHRRVTAELARRRTRVSQNDSAAGQNALSGIPGELRK